MGRMKKIITLLLLPTLIFVDSCGLKDRTQTISGSDSTRILQLCQLANDSLLHTQPDSALVLAKKLLEESKSLRFKHGIIAGLDALGNIYGTIGDYALSIAYYQQAIDLCPKDYKNGSVCLHLHNAIGVTLVYAGDYREAASYFYKAIAMGEEFANNKIEGSIYNNLFSLWLYMNDSAKALSYLDQAEAAARATNDSNLLGNTLNRQAIMRLYSDSMAAYRYLKEAEKISSACGDKQTQQQVQFNLIFLPLQKGDTMAVYRQLAIAEKDLKTGNIYTQIEGAAGIGSVYLVLKNYQRALFYLQKSYNLADSIRSPWQKKKPVDNLYQLYTQVGNYEMAVKFQRESDQIATALSNKQRQQEIKWLESKYEQASQELKEKHIRLVLLKQEASLRHQRMWLGGSGLLTGFILFLYLLGRRHLKHNLELQEKRHLAARQEQELLSTQAAFEGEEKERKRVAMELHDHVGSMLSVAKLHLSTICNQPVVPATSSSALREIMDLLDQSYRSIRHTAHHLLPDILLKGGLREALSLYCQRLNRKDRLIAFENYGAVVQLEQQQERHLFRAFSKLTELLLSHLQPRRLLLQLNWHDDVLYTTVEMEYNPDIATSSPDVWLPLLQQCIKPAHGLLYQEALPEEFHTLDLEFAL